MNSAIGLLLFLAPLWAGETPFLKERGLSFDLVYTGEVMGAVSGGLKDDMGYLDNLDIILNYDKRNSDGNGWSGVLYLLYNNGYDPSEDIGDVQTTSNIETYDTTRVFEAWVQRHYGAHNLLFGLFDVNSEFDVIDTAQLFLNSSHGIGPDFSQAGDNGPSIFPSTSLAFRYL